MQRYDPICHGNGDFGKMDEVELEIDAQGDHESFGWAGYDPLWLTVSALNPELSTPLSSSTLRTDRGLDGFTEDMADEEVALLDVGGDV
jgi:hypothetical protein